MREVCEYLKDGKLNFLDKEINQKIPYLIRINFDHRTTKYVIAMPLIISYNVNLNYMQCLKTLPVKMPAFTHKHET